MILQPRRSKLDCWSTALVAALIGLVIAPSGTKAQQGDRPLIYCADEGGLGCQFGLGALFVAFRAAGAPTVDRVVSPNLPDDLTPYSLVIIYAPRSALPAAVHDALVDFHTAGGSLFAVGNQGPTIDLETLDALAIATGNDLTYGGGVIPAAGLAETVRHPLTVGAATIEFSGAVEVTEGSVLAVYLDLPFLAAGRRFVMSGDLTMLLTFINDNFGNEAFVRNVFASSLPLRLSEVRIQRDGDPSEVYIELEGLAESSLDDRAIALVRADADDFGIVSEVIPLDGSIVAEDGFFVLGTESVVPEPDLFLEPSSLAYDADVTVLLLSNGVPSVGEDVDTNDDGRVDVYPWGGLIDVVALSADPPAEPPAHYGPPAVGPDRGGVPAHAYRCPGDSGEWRIDGFPAGGPRDTPGQPSVACGPCGDLVLDDAEECDDGHLNGTLQSCCSLECQFRSEGTACSDDVFCVAGDTCDGAGSCESGSANPCDAGDACNNTCNEEADTCFSPAGADCDDGLFCTASDACDGEGLCTGDDPCAGEDVCHQCNEAFDACRSPLGTPCDDGLFCTASDFCDGLGECVGSGDACAAGDTCNNSCNEETDDCFATAATPCDDGLFCTAVDECDGAGECEGSVDPCAGNEECNASCNEDADDCFAPRDTPCGDPGANSCDRPDSCNGFGDCQANRFPHGTPCSDNGVFCDGAESCVAGVCTSAGSVCHPELERCDELRNRCVVLCANGQLDGDEGCDDANTDDGDGCSSGCEVEHGWACSVADDGASVCETVCGDGIVMRDEVCDDENDQPDDGCRDCVIEDGWVCNDDEPSRCSLTPFCGDGALDDGEDCDDGNDDDDDGCSAECDVEPGWSCDDLLPTTCLPDADGDKVPDGDDLCPVDPDPEQLDSDGDGLGDVCDPCPTADSCLLPEIEADAGGSDAGEGGLAADDGCGCASGPRSGGDGVAVGVAILMLGGRRRHRLSSRRPRQPAPR